MDKIQKVLIKVGRKDLAQKYYEKVAGGAAAFGKADKFNFAVKLKSLSDNEIFSMNFSDRINAMAQAKKFMNDPSTKKGYVGAKGKATMPAVKQWVKENKPSEFYAQWQGDSSNYKDDSVEIYYK